MERISIHPIKLLLLTITGVLTTSLLVRAQQPAEVSGKVITAETQEPVAGATITVKGTARQTATDEKGLFRIQAAEGDTLVCSSIGFTTQEKTVGALTSYTFSLLSAQAETMEEVVVIGYGTAKRSDLTGSITRVDAAQFKNQPTTQLTEMLNGTVAGFNSNQSTTAAGGGSMEIRGPKSLNASTNPMIVLDGVIYNGSLSDINPADIQSMDILKDASSTAVYGARAAAGVIQVTTRKGIQGPPKISVSANTGIAQLQHAFTPYDGAGYIRFRQDLMRSNNPNNPSYYYLNPNELPAGVSLEDWRNASNNPQADNTREWLSRLNFFDIETENYLAGKTVYWLDEVFRNGVRQNYDLSINGGAERVKYYWSLGYQDNEGIKIGDKFNTIRSRVNTEFTLNNWLSAGINAQFSDRNQQAIIPNLGAMFIMSPYGSVYDENGNVKWYPNDFPTASPVINNLGGQDQFNKVNSLFSSIFMTVKLPADISYKISFQPRYEFTKLYNFWPSTTIEGGSTHTDGYATRRDASSFEWILDHLIHWNKSFGMHQFDVTLLYSAESLRGWQSDLSNQLFSPNESLGFHGIQFGSDHNVGADDMRATGDAAMARLNYTLNDKYLLTASIRRDGYSAFGNKNPRATFPALALAWRVSQEPFFQVPAIDDLKLRVSWGRNGNRSIGEYAALATVNSTRYYDGSATRIGVYNNTLSNYDLRWEQTESLNVGIDLAMLNNRLSLTADVYDMTTTDLLMERLLPEITGYTDVVTNLGELGNKGWELTVNTVNVSKPKFRWTSSFVYSANRNKIKRLFGDYGDVTVNGKSGYQELPDYSNEWFPGQSIDRIWNYRVLGIWQTDETEEAAAYGLKPGDFKVVDVDGNYVYDALTDKQFIGYEQPRHRLGLRNTFDFLQNFSFSFFLRAELGHMGYFNEAERRGGSDTYDRRSTYDLPYWTPENGNNEYPRLNTVTTAFGGGIRIFKPRSFVRLQDVSLSYTLPEELARKIHTNDLRIFASARNLLTFDRWPGWDPETVPSYNPSNGGYATNANLMPLPRTFSFGINFSL